MPSSIPVYGGLGIMVVSWAAILLSPLMFLGIPLGFVVFLWGLHYNATTGR